MALAMRSLALSRVALTVVRSSDRSCSKVARSLWQSTSALRVWLTWCLDSVPPISRMRYRRWPRTRAQGCQASAGARGYAVVHVSAGSARVVVGCDVDLCSIPHSGRALADHVKQFYIGSREP